MLVTLHPTYTFRVTVKRPAPVNEFVNAAAQAAQSWKLSYGEFWDGIKGTTGCDEVMTAVTKALADSGLGAHVDVRFESYSEKPL